MAQGNEPSLKSPAEIGRGDRRDRPRRFRLRYSLRTLILLVTFSALAAALWSQSQRLERATVELDKYRDEQGYLRISDRKKVQAVGVRTSGSLKWRWRVFLPEGRQYRLHNVTGPIPARGIPQPWVLSGSTSPINPGEFLLEAAVERNRRGRWVLSTAWPGARGSVSIPQTKRPWIEEGVGYETSRIAVGPTKTVEPGKPLVLLRLRVHDVFKNKNGMVLRTSAPPGPCDGLLIWIEEIKAK